MPTAAQRWREATKGHLEEMRFSLDLAGSPDIVTALAVIDDLCDRAALLRQLAVSEARTQGATWEEIGEALGVSRQAAWERFKGAGPNGCAVPVTTNGHAR